MEVFIPSSANSSNPNGVVQSSPANNSKPKSDADIENLISKKCKTHPKKNADLLHLKSNAANPIICISCVQQNDIQTKEYLQIKDVLQGSSDSDFFTFPVLKDPRLRQEIQPNFNLLDSDKSQIDLFYQELFQQVQVKIEVRRQTKQLELLELAEKYKSSMKCWSEILDIDNLKAILYEENNEQKLISFINEHLANSESNTKTLRELCDQFKAIQSQFSMEKPNQIKNLISTLIEQINFFEGNNSLSPQSVNQSFSSRNELQLKQEVDQLQQQLSDCRSQLQEQQLINEELRVANRQQDNQISELSQKLNEEKEKSSRQKDELENENRQNPSSANQPQQPVLKEVMALGYTNLLPTTNLVLGNVWDSQKLFVKKKNQEQLQFGNNDDTKEFLQGRSYLDFILDPQVNYVVNVKLKQRIGQEKYFVFGLISDSKKDYDGILSDNELLWYNEQNDYGDFNTLLKGKPIKTKYNYLEKRSLEMRINIQKKILKVGSLPNYESVVQIDNPEQIEPGNPYRFYLGGLCRQTKITITKLATVSQFDNLM